MRPVAFIIIELHANSAFCVSAPEINSTIHRPAARNPLTGAPIVPMTSLMGSLRAHAESTHRQAAQEVFGTVRSEHTNRDEDAEEHLKGFPTQIRGLGVRVWLNGAEADAAVLQQRKQTSIDRDRGAAPAQMLHTSETVPAGARLTMYLEVLEVEQLNTVLGWIETWKPTIGGRRSVGLGRARVTSVRHGILDLGTANDLDLFLKRGGPELVEAVAISTASTSDDTTETERGALDDNAGAPVTKYVFELVSPLLIRGETVGNVTGALKRGSWHVVDGSTWKGVFRAGAEYICNSIAGVVGGDPDASLIDRLFGSTGRRGALSFHESKLEESVEVVRTHVAIDRVTGGARDQKLFTDRPVAKGKVTLTVTALSDISDVIEDARTLLDAVARDIHDGYLGVGSGTTRGYGTLRVTEPVLEVRDNLVELFFPKPDQEVANA